MKLRNLIILGGTAITLMVAGVAIFNEFAIHDEEAMNKALMLDVTQRLEKVANLGDATRQIQLDIVQTQQFLTDISATRGLDGLNDGFDKAAEFAAALPKDVERAKALAQEFDRPGLIEALDAVELAYGDFYAQGQKMAQSYVDFGPEIGNRMMESFDGAAHTLDKSMEEVAKRTEGLHELVISDVEAKEAEALAAQQRRFMISLGSNSAVVLLVAAMVGFLILMVVRQLTALTQTARTLADGDYEAEGVPQSRWDELENLRAAIEIFRANGIERLRLTGQSEAEQRAREERQQRIDTLIRDFRETVTGALEVVASNTTEMSATANTLTAVANGTSGQANDATYASQSASENVQAVAAAAEELAASIEEISRQVAKTNTIVNDATIAANASNEKVANLAQAAQKIGDVISLIQDIAEQTNLLALNTSIEAARAGEAGKGFAVVASEVKSLANQTATATEEISAQIANIQSSTTEAVQAIEEIAKTMAEVNSYTASIASAVEEQGAATAEISQSVAQAASGTKQVVDSMGSVSSSVDETNQSAAQVLAASEDVSKQAHTLKSTVDKFLNEVAAA